MKETEQEEFEKNLENLRQELRRGTLVLAVLGRLKEPRYGYSLVETLAARGIQAEAGTLYPLLRRLETQGLLASEWETSGPKPRKYYVLTSRGERMLDLLSIEWQQITKQMIDLLREE